MGLERNMTEYEGISLIEQVEFIKTFLEGEPPENSSTEYGGLSLSEKIKLFNIGESNKKRRAITKAKYAAAVKKAGKVGGKWGVELAGLEPIRPHVDHTVPEVAGKSHPKVDKMKRRRSQEMDSKKWRADHEKKQVEVRRKGEPISRPATPANKHTTFWAKMAAKNRNDKAENWYKRKKEANKTK